MSLIVDPVLDLAAFGCARRGASHKSEADPKPCQDSHLILSGSSAGAPYCIAAVADGHGSEKHDRSQIGSFLAVQAAARALLEFHGAFAGAGITTLRRSFTSDFPRRASRAWQADVRCHYLQDNPEPPGKSPGSAPDYRPVYSRYGSTLLAAMIVNDTLLLAQVGDGDIVLILDGGGAEQPLAAPDSLVGGETFSLCSPDAPNLWRTATVELHSVRFLALSTDGLRNAYENDEPFYSLLAKMGENIEEFGARKSAGVVPDYLDRFSLRGSGDDITLVGIQLGKRAAAAHQPEPISPQAASQAQAPAPAPAAAPDATVPSSISMAATAPLPPWAGARSGANTGAGAASSPPPPAPAQSAPPGAPAGQSPFEAFRLYPAPRSPQPRPPLPDEEEEPPAPIV